MEQYIHTPGISVLFILCDQPLASVDLSVSYLQIQAVSVKFNSFMVGKISANGNRTWDL